MNDTIIFNQYRKSMARTNFENLRVYQLLDNLADEIWDVAKDQD